MPSGTSGLTCTQNTSLLPPCLYPCIPRLSQVLPEEHQSRMLIVQEVPSSGKEPVLSLLSLSKQDLLVLRLSPQIIQIQLCWLVAWYLFKSYFCSVTNMWVCVSECGYRCPQRPETPDHPGTGITGNGASHHGC